MKKTIKRLTSMLATASVAFTMVLPTVSAQDTNWDEVLTQINAVNQELVSMEGDGTITVAAQNMLDATLTTDFRYNTEERFALDASADLTGEMITSDAEGNETTSPINFGGQVTVLDGVAYLFDGSSWTVEDISAQEEQIAAQFEEIMAQTTEQAETLNDPAITQKYFDLSETDTDYVMTLKQDINPDEFWADVESQVDLEAIKQESIDQALEQAQSSATATGEELTQEEIDELTQQIDQSFEASKEVGFQLINSIEIRYSKENYYLTYMSMDFGLDYADMEKIAANMGESMEGIPEDFNVSFVMEFNFRNHGQVFDIVVPEGAPTFDSTEESTTEESTTEESAEESNENPAEGESVEETTEEPAEESTEETTEEPVAEEEETDSAQ
ncbi:hypothetical protein ACF3NG_09560 [Aerococcaceae bacterium WGS1372]